MFFFEGPFPTAGTARIPVLGGASGWGLCSKDLMFRAQGFGVSVVTAGLRNLF